MAWRETSRPSEAAVTVNSSRVASGLSIQVNRQVCRKEEPEKALWRLMNPQERAVASAVAAKRSCRTTARLSNVVVMGGSWLGEGDTLSARNSPPFGHLAHYVDMNGFRKACTRGYVSAALRAPERR